VTLFICLDLIIHEFVSNIRTIALGTATGIADFDELISKQKDGSQGPACVGENTAYADYLKIAFPTIKLVGVPSNDMGYYEALRDGTCDVCINDAPIGSVFIAERFANGECNIDGKPIGMIGEPLGFGPSQYAVGIKNSISSNLPDAISYWLLMDCAPGNEDGACPSSGIGGSLHESYTGVVGTGDECGYTSNPDSTSDASVRGESLAGVVASSVAFFIFSLW
jgi:hypothetical protein